MTTLDGVYEADVSVPTLKPSLQYVVRCRAAPNEQVSMCRRPRQGPLHNPPSVAHQDPFQGHIGDGGRARRVFEFERECDTVVVAIECQRGRDDVSGDSDLGTTVDPECGLTEAGSILAAKRTNHQAVGSRTCVTYGQDTVCPVSQP